MEKYFNLAKNGTSIKQEFTAGFVTFCSMVYILIVNARMYTDPFGTGENVLGLPFGAIYIATALSAFVGCSLIGLIAKLPIALASGMGLNAFFVYTVCMTLGFSYENALAIIMCEGLIFLLLTLTGGIKKIYEAIPDCIRYSISAGIGLFIALLGFINSGIVIPNKATGLTLNSFNLLHVPVQQVIPAFISLFCLFIIVLFLKKNIKGAVLWGMLSGVILYYTIALLNPGLHLGQHIETLNPICSFKEFFHYSFGVVFTSGFDFSGYIELHGFASFLVSVVTTTVAFCLVNIFDNIGTLQATCEYGKFLKDNDIPEINKAMKASSFAAIAGATMGVSTVTSYVESATGIAEGGKTGLTAISTGLFFLLALLFSPLAQFVPSCATSAALIYIGILMMSSVKNIDWSNIENTVPVFLTICIMPYTCNISNGIAFGLLSYVVINTLVGKFKEIKPATWLIVGLFLIMLLFSR